MRLPIADCRLPIRESLSRRSLARRSHYGGQLVRFGQKSRTLARRHSFGLDQQFEPKRRLISFFFNRADLGNKFGWAARSATGPIICRYRSRSATANNLLGNRTTSIVILGNGPRQIDDPPGKGFSASLQFGRIHGAKVQTQSAIGNQQSAISL